MKATPDIVGRRIRFDGWGVTDPASDLAVGTLGTVSFVDGTGTIHVSWDEGSRLGLLTGPMIDEIVEEFKPDLFTIDPEETK